MSDYQNPEMLSFEKDAMFDVPVLPFNNGKPIPTVGIYQATQQEGTNKPFPKRHYGYRPLFIPSAKNGKFDVSYRKGRTDDNWIVYIYIDLDNPEFKELVCRQMKELHKAETNLGIEQLTTNNIKARPIYEFKVIDFSMDGDRSFMTLQEPSNGINYLATTDMYSDFSVRVVTKTEADAKYIVDNPDQIIITFQYTLKKVTSDTNSLTIKVSDLVETKAFKDIKGSAQGKYIQRGDVRKLINTLVSNLSIVRNIERPEIANNAANDLLNQFLQRIAQQSDHFAENAQKFYEEKTYSDKDYQPDLFTGEVSESKDQLRNKFVLDTSFSTDKSFSKEGSIGQLFSSKLSGSLKTESKVRNENELETLTERKNQWTGEKYDPKNLVLLTDVLSAFEQSYDLSYQDVYVTKSAATEPYTLTFANYDYTPKPPEPQVEVPAPQVEAPPAIITETAKDLNLELIRVEGGTFLMGGQDNEVQESEKPVYEVELDAFYIGKYPVTQAQYRKIMNNNPSHFRGDNLPVEQVSWEDALEFCHRLSDLTGKKYYLPTEAQWEYAARGGHKARGGYKYAGSNNLDTVAWYAANSGNTTRPVGQKNANELGIHDMSGNVWEWCWDWYNDKYYAGSPKKNPQGPSSGSYRVLRGGSWNYSAVSCRVASRHGNTPTNRNNPYGFRIVLLP